MHKRHLASLALVVALVSPGVRAAALGAQSLPVSTQVRIANTVLIMPRAVELTSAAREATVQLINVGPRPLEADVMLQFAYPHYPTRDTALFSEDLAGTRARDTVIADPGPAEPYAGRWITGVPTRVTLQPGESRPVTLRIAPPAGLKDGEYWARLVTIVRTPDKKRAPAKDAKQRFQLPVKGELPPELRDQVPIFYRHGAVKAGLQVVDARAVVDTGDRAPGNKLGPHQVWQLFRLKPTGNAHVEGVLKPSVREEATGKVIHYEPGYAFTLYREGILRFWAATNILNPGRYTLLIRFEPAPAGTPGALPFEPVERQFPFVVP